MEIAAVAAEVTCRSLAHGCPVISCFCIDKRRPLETIHPPRLGSDEQGLHLTVTGDEPERAQLEPQEHAGPALSVTPLLNANELAPKRQVVSGRQLVEVANARQRGVRGYAPRGHFREAVR